MNIEQYKKMLNDLSPVEPLTEEQIDAIPFDGLVEEYQSIVQAFNNLLNISRKVIENE